MRSVSNGAYVIISNCSEQRAVLPCFRPQPSLLKTHVDRHSLPPSAVFLRESKLVNVNISRRTSLLNVGVLNVRSLGNSSAAVLNIIVDNSLYLFAAVGSWHDSADSPSLIASTPLGFQVFERARPCTTKKLPSMKSNHGGLCIFVRRGIQASIVDLPSFKTLELLSLFVRSGPQSFVFVALYRPEPASAVKEDFFTDLTDVLERTSSFSGCIIVGDLNLHIDETSNSHTTRFLSLLEGFGLCDRVCRLMH
jgi:hypothetical protein